MEKINFNPCDNDITRDTETPTISRTNPNHLPCSSCGSTERKLGIGKGPHLASLRCAACDLRFAAALRYRFIRWVGKSELAKIQGGQA
jgi:hypothetical protein